METYTQGDTSPDLVFECVQDGVTLSLSGVLAVMLKMEKPSGATVARAMTVDLTPTTGLVSYTPVAGDFDEAGDVQCDVSITFADARVQHIIEPFLIRVRPEYEAA